MGGRWWLAGWLRERMRTRRTGGKGRRGGRAGRGGAFRGPGGGMEARERVGEKEYASWLG